MIAKTHVRPTNRLFALAGGSLLLFAVGTNVQAGWVLAIAALLFGLMLVGLALPYGALNGIDVERVVPPSASEGAPVDIGLRVTNGGSRTRVLIGINDEFCGTGSAVVGLIAPGQSRVYRSQREGARRGVYEQGPCTLVSGAPFGVMRATKSTQPTSRIVVTPRTYDVDIVRFLGAGAVPTAAAIGDVSSVRDYRPGDPLRHVHWRSVARHGRLVVREFDDHRDADVLVGAEVGDDRDVADAIARIACSLAVPLLRDGEVALISAARPAGDRARSTETVLEWGARLEPGPLDIANTAIEARAVVIVCAPTSRIVEGAEQLAARQPVTVVLVGDGTERVAARLRGAGARVAEVATDEVEGWFRNGCATG